MSKEYESAKRIALGIERERTVDPGDDLWNVSVGADVGFGSFMAEMPFQYFERSFEELEEQTMHKAALMLFDEEYLRDKQSADDNLRKLITAFKTSDAEGIRKLMSDAPAAQWLSLIFIDGTVLLKELVPAMEESTPECRKAFADAADQALNDLVEFRDLMEALRGLC